jgi:hypothetical protein
MELPLSLDAGHQGTLVASPEALGWDVRVDVDGVTVFRSHVRDWHRVERLRARVEAIHGSYAHPTSSVNAVPGTETARSLRR